LAKACIWALFKNWEKNDFYVRHASLSVRLLFVILSVLMERFGCHWTDFHKIWNMSIVRRSLKNFNFIVRKSLENFNFIFRKILKNFNFIVRKSLKILNFIVRKSLENFNFIFRKSLKNFYFIIRKSLKKF